MNSKCLVLVLVLKKKNPAIYVNALWKNKFKLTFEAFAQRARLQCHFWNISYLSSSHGPIKLTAIWAHFWFPNSST